MTYTPEQKANFVAAALKALGTTALAKDLNISPLQHGDTTMPATHDDEDDEELELESNFDDNEQEEEEAELDELKENDPVAYFDKVPQALLAETLDELKNLQVQYEENFVKKAAKLGHKEAQAFLSGGSKVTAASQKPLVFPSLCWYDSDSHKKRRYYGGAKGENGNPVWVEKEKAVEILSVDHAFLVRRICANRGYRKTQFAPPSES